MADGGSIGLLTCPACGLAVSPGYPNCPKCQAPMPSAPSLGADSRSRTVQGGTAVSSGPGPYLWIAVAGVVVVAAVIVYVARGSDRKAAGPRVAAPVPAVDTAPTRGPAIAAPDPFPRTDPDPAVTARDDLTRARTRAAAAVESALEGARLWGTVEIVGEQLHIHSAYCASIEADLLGDDELLRAARTEAEAPLFESVSCFERHGPVAWERPLSAAAAASP